MRPPKPKRTHILNGFGRTLGDSLIGLQALETAIRLNPEFGQPVLYRLPGLASVIQELYEHAEFAQIRELPWSHAIPDLAFCPGEGGDTLIDIRDFAYDTAFLRTSMIDFFLGRLGLDPARVAAPLKRNTWLRSRISPRKPDLPDGFVLVCPAASNPMRRMPEAIHGKILAHLAPAGEVVTQGRVPAGLERRVRSRPREDSLAGLCNLVAHARWVISTDTAMVHFADTFDVPCLAFFPTHDPDWRVRDYPLCTPVPLVGAQPAGLEFVRRPDDLRAAHHAWFPHGDDLSWLEPLLDAPPHPASDTPRARPPRPR
jgi:hypothetical protein